VKGLSGTIASLFLIAASPAQAEQTRAPAGAMPSADDIRAVAPALEAYRRRTLVADLWKRPGLSARDRSLVTLAALIANGQTIELAHHLERALDSGVKPSEISGLITHLAFYSGSANAPRSWSRRMSSPGATSAPTSFRRRQWRRFR
jgi:4-carboxymuconolactone decarboxylase